MSRPDRIVIHWDDSDPQIEAGWCYRMIWYRLDHEHDEGLEDREETGELELAAGRGKDTHPVELFALARTELACWGIADGRYSSQPTPCSFGWWWDRV